MSREIEVGDRVRHHAGKEEGTVLAIGPDWLLVRYKERNEGWCRIMCHLIEPAMPKPKYAVRQPVAIKDGQRDHLEIEEVLCGFRYRLRCLPHKEGKTDFPEKVPANTWKEEDLEAVPVCPTCGKVGDGQ